MADELEPVLPSSADSLMDSIDPYLLGIPGCARALSRLITSAADAGSKILKAKADQISSGMKDQAGISQEISKALAKAAARAGTQDQALVARTLDGWAEKHLREQINRERVAKKTADHLRDGETIDQESEGPSDEWLDTFEVFAARASTERMQDIWARVLAGEIRHRGEYSLRTLSFLAVLDTDLAACVTRAFGCVIAECIPTAGPFDRGSLYSDLISLDAVGVVKLGSAKHFKLESEVTGCLVGSTYVLEIRGTAPDFSIGGAILTQVGVELYRLIKPDVNITLVSQVVEALQKVNSGHTLTLRKL